MACVAGVLWAVDVGGQTRFVYHNLSDYSQAVYITRFSGGGCTGSSEQLAGSAATVGAHSESYVDIGVYGGYAYWALTFNGGHCAGQAICVGAIAFSGTNHVYWGNGCGVEYTTNYYCVYNIGWTNSGAKYTGFGYYLDTPSGPSFPTNMEARIISPGGYVSFGLTNNVGTNGCQCYDIIAGSDRPAFEVADAVIEGTCYYTIEAAPGNGYGDNRVNPGTNPNTKYPDAGTNAPTQADLRRLEDALSALAGELAGLNDDAHAGWMSLGGYSGYMSNGMFFLTLNTTNLVDSMDGLKESSEGVRTNTAAIMTNTITLTNLTALTNLGPLTNLADMLDYYSNLAAGAQSAQSNGLWWATNWPGGYSNSSGGGLWLSAISTNTVRTDDVESFGDMLGYINGAEGPGSLFRLSFGPSGYEVDFAKALDGGCLEDGRYGVRKDGEWVPVPQTAYGWKELIWFFEVWGPLLMLIVIYADEVRAAVRDVCGIPAFPVSDLATGAASGIPGASSGGALTARGVLVAGLMVLLMFIPSIVAAAMDNSSGASFGVTGSGAVGQVATGTKLPSFTGYFWTLCKLLNEWIPIIPYIVYAVNFLVARLLLNGLVAGLMPMMKGWGA